MNLPLISMLKTSFYIAPLQQILFFMLIFLVGCLPKREAQEEEKYFFDLQKLLHNQANKLNLEKPTITKIIITSQDTVTQKVKIKSWMTELQPFVDCDINVPVLKDAYVIDEQPNKIIYKAKKKHLKVQKITIEKQENQIVSVQINYIKKNRLYYTERFLEMRLMNNKLKSYVIKGVHKIKSKEPNRYQIQGIISDDN